MPGKVELVQLSPGSPGSLTAFKTAACGTVRKRFHKQLSAGDTLGMEDGRKQLQAVAGSFTAIWKPGFKSKGKSQRLVIKIHKNFRIIKKKKFHDLNK